LKRTTLVTSVEQTAKLSSIDFLQEKGTEEPTGYVAAIVNVVISFEKAEHFFEKKITKYKNKNIKTKYFIFSLNQI
jgi:hypothetical protein